MGQTRGEDVLKGSSWCSVNCRNRISSFCVLFVPLPIPCCQNYWSYITLTLEGKIPLFSTMIGLFYSFSLCAQRNLYKNVHSTVTQNSRKLETTQMSSSGEWLDRRVRLGCGTLLGRDEGTQYQYTQHRGWASRKLCSVRKPLSSGYTWHYSIYIVVLK